MPHILIGSHIPHIAKEGLNLAAIPKKLLTVAQAFSLPRARIILGLDMGCGCDERHLTILLIPGDMRTNSGVSRAAFSTVGLPAIFDGAEESQRTAN